MIADVYPLSPLQEGLYYHWLSEPNSSAYFQQMSYRVKGNLNVSALEKSYALLVARHSVLRTVFTQKVGEKILQVVKKEVPSNFNYVRIKNEKNDVEEYKRLDRSKGFDLGSGSQMRLSVLDVGNDVYEFIWSFHHILMDGWCIGILIKEFFEIYESCLQNKEPQLPKVYPYATYIKWLETIDKTQSLQYWKNYLTGYDTVSSLPKTALNADQSYVTEETTLSISGDIRTSIKKQCAALGITENTFIQTIWGILLSKYNNTNDVVFGAVVSGRPAEIEGIEEMIGLFINTIPVRIQMNDTITVSELLKQVQKLSNEGIKHHYTQLAEIQSESELGRDLFDHIMVFENYPVQEMVQQTINNQDNEHPFTLIAADAFEQTNYNLTLVVIPGDVLMIKCRYNPAVYDTLYIQQVQKHIEAIITQVIQHPEQYIHQIEYLSAFEKQQLLEGLNNTNIDYPKDKTIIDLFEEQVAKTPNNTAIIFEDNILTYQQLNEQSNRLAGYLRINYHIQPDDLIALQLARSEWMVIAMLATLKVGAAYVPIDPEYPQERIDYTISDSQCKVVIDEKELEKFKQEENKYAKHNVQHIHQPNNLAYVIYTSGTTGKPKGTLIEHRNVVRLFKNEKPLFDFTPNDVWTMFHSYCFDFSVWEMYGALLFGGKLVVISSLTAKDPEAYLHILRTQKVTVLNQTPSSFYNLIKHELAQQTTALQLRYIIFGGEALSPGKLKSWKQKYPTTKLINMYGITETTVHVTYKEITDNEIENNISNIGKPIPTLSCYILDKHQNLLPIGVASELYVGGAGVARGYLNRKELTQEKFILNPYKKEERLYRSGDKAKRLINGELEYLGRIDEQVKIRGYRIELGEIEAALQKHPHIQTTVVIAKANEEGEKELVAYIVSKQELNATDVRSYLSQHLPAYLIPTHYVQLQQIPLTSNGKLDKKALPDPTTWGLRTGVQYIAPRNETEEKLTALWQKILAKETIGVHDNFFELGGHSLKLTRLAAQIHKLFEIQIELKELFVHTTIEAQAQYIAQTKKKGYTAIPLAPQQNDYPLSSSQRRLWVLSQFEESNSAYNMPGVYVLEGNLNIEALQYAFNTVVERHESLRTFFVENEQQEIKQIIQPYPETISKIVYQDLRSKADQPQTIREIIHQNCIAPFDLRTAPLIRTALYQTANNQWILVYVMHHIISDGWSMEVLINEVLTIYNAYIKKEKNPLMPLHIQYKDYAVWQQQQLNEPASQANKQYWLQQFQGELPVLSLLTDKPRPAIKTYNGASVQKRIHIDLFNRLQTFNQQQGCTLFMSLVAAVNTLLYRYTQQEDIIIGSVVAGREHADLENQIGFYVNTIALRTLFKGKNSFQELVQNIKQTTLQSYEHQLFPFDELVDALQLKHDTSKNPLFDIMVVLQNTETDHASTRQPIDGLSIHNYEDENRVTKFDISFNFAEIQNQLYVHVEYNTDIYEEHTVVQLTNHLERLLQEALQQPTTSIQSLKYLSDHEESLFKSFNKVEPYFSLDKNIIEHIEEKALLQPHKTAIQFNEQLIDYATLNNVSNQLAQYLVEKHTTGKDVLIGVMMHRSITMAESILGIWKTGSAYVPLDTDYPAERIQQIIEAGQIKALIVDQTVSAQQIEQLQLHIPVIHIDEIRSYLKKLSTHNLNKTIAANDLAYVIYTSGSTGQPKGVMIEHLGMMNHIGAKIVELQISEESKLAQNAPHTFDISVWQLFAGLVAGGKTVIYSNEIILEPSRFIQQLHADSISVLELVPSYFVEMLSVLEEQKDAHLLEELKILILNAETLMPSMVKRWLTLYPNIPIVNTYGATETSDDTSHYIMHSLPDTSTVPVMQKPIQYFEVHLVDEQLQRVPIGAIGEVLLCGIAVGRGYLNDEAKTKQSFLTGPLPGITETKRIYRTGDLARYLPDGRMEFLGRKDTQVKIRGHRIELGEIEHALMEIVEIENTTVLANVEEQYLAAYYQSAKALSREDIMELLKKKLPSYMLPHYYIRMEQFPLSANGKIDKKQLPNPEMLGLSTGANYIAPTNETEKKLVAIWQNILGKEKISTHDNFFELGGHSLKAIRLAGQVYKQFNVKLSLQQIFNHPVLQQQAQWIQQSNTVQYINIKPVQQQPCYDLSAAQRRLWVISQFKEANIAYNIPGVYMLEGNLDKASLDKAFQTIIERHEILRTIFKEDEKSTVKQYIINAKDILFNISYVDCRDQESDDIKNAIQSDVLQPFDLTVAPLLRAHLYQTKNNKWILVYVMHHIISDGWSMQVMVDEVLSLYNAYVTNQLNPLQPLRIQYKDYAAWQQQQLQDTAIQSHQQYWLQQFQGELPLLNLPTDKPRPVVKTYNGATLEKTFDAALTNCLATITKEQGATLFMGLLAAVNTLLYKYTNQEDIIIGSPIAGREHADLENQIGFYVNTLALRTSFNAQENYKQLLERVKQTTLAAYEHQLYPFDELVDALHLQRDLSRSPLFDVMVILQNTKLHHAVETPKLTGLAVSEYTESMEVNSKFDITFNFIEIEESLHLTIEYNTDIYYASTIQRMAMHLEQLFNAVVQDATKPIHQLNILTKKEEQQLLVAFNDTAVSYPKNKTIISLFEEQAVQTPNHIAVLYEDKTLTYQQLNEQANQLAHYLKTKCTIKADDLIGIQLQRNEWMIIAMLAVLKAGGAYVPIDPEYPQERIDYIIADSKCKLVINEKELEEFKKEANTYAKHNLQQVNQPNDLAYIIYTSGSTGQPKGVMIEHCNVYTFICWCKQAFATADVDTVFATTSICFDLSIFEIFYTLTTAKKLRLLKDGLAIPTYIQTNEKILINTVPSVVGVLLSNHVNLQAVTTLNMAGEPIPKHYIDSLLQQYKNIHIRNLYGPSEDTTYSTVYKIKDNNTALIGVPIANTQVYIINEQLQLQPIGVVGEICIAGSGLARGYLYKPELTAEKFVANPFKAGERMYKTGDIGRWLENGNIEFMGRKDDQVKIRGYRIELGEIEATLQKHENIAAAVVTTKINSAGEKELIAYIVNKEALNKADIRNYLSHWLPAYALPVHYIFLKQLPLTPNGKVDKKKLPNPETAVLAEASTYVAPSTNTEKQLAYIWKQILDIEKIGVHDDFFMLGGQSLKATRLISQIHKQFNVKLALEDVFTTTTLQNQAALIDQSNSSTYNNIQPAQKQDSYPLTSSQYRLWVLSQLEEGNMAYSMPGVYIIEGALNYTALEKAFDNLIERHEILRTVFHENEQSAIRQYIKQPAEIHFKIDYQNIESINISDEFVEQHIQQVIQQPFNLATGPLLRVTVYQLANNKWIFVYVMHHIISDGWSLNVLMQEWLALYNAHATNQSNALQPLRIQYKDYAVWEQQQLQHESLQEHKQYWIQQFKTGIPVLDVSLKSRPSNFSYKGDTFSFIIDENKTDHLTQITNQHQGTLFNTLLLLVKLLLHKYTRQNTIMVGTSLGGRNNHELENQIGLYLNNLPLITNIQKQHTINEVYASIKNTVLQTLQHQLYPLDKLMNDIHYKKDNSRPGLFNVFIEYHTNETKQTDFTMHQCIVQPYHQKLNISLFDLSFDFQKVDNTIQAVIIYNTDLFNVADIELLKERFLHLVENIQQLFNNHKKIEDIDYSIPQHRQTKKQIQLNVEEKF